MKPSPMRGVLAAGTALAAVLATSGAEAQVDRGALRDRNAARMEAESLRQDQMAAARQAQAARDRAGTAAVLDDLRPTRDPMALKPARALPERGDPAAALSLRLDDLDRLTDARLARSNAAIRAVRPASDR